MHMMTLDTAEKFAKRMREKLAPYCDRIEIAGSVRRRKHNGIKDIELVIIPTVSDDPKPGSLFASGAWRPLLHYLDELTSAADGRFKRAAWGDRYRKLIFCGGGGVAFDLFFVQPETWGTQFALRTGPAGFSKLLVTPRRFDGALPDGWNIRHGRAVHTLGTEATKRFETEGEFFRFLELPHWEPHVRSELNLKRFLDQTKEKV